MACEKWWFIHFSISAGISGKKRPDSLLDDVKDALGVLLGEAFDLQVPFELAVGMFGAGYTKRPRPGMGVHPKGTDTQTHKTATKTKTTEMPIRDGNGD